MKRKVVKHGTATLTISLPVQWVKKFDIRQGHELDVEERGHSLIVRPFNELIEKEAVVNIEEKENIPKRIVLRYYTNGYNKIRIKYKHIEARAYVNNLINNYIMGFEIVEQGENYYVIKNIAKGIEEEFDVMLNRLAIVTIGALKDLKETFIKNDLRMLSDIKSAEVSANKIDLFCRRMLNLIGHKNRTATSLYTIAKSYEAITDDCNNIATYLTKNKVKISKETINYISSIIQFSEMIHKDFKTSNTENFMKLKEMDMRMKKEREGFIETCRVHERFIIACLISIQGTLHHLCDEL